MLSREGVAAIWQLHLNAAAAFRRGNWLSATALVGIADAAERLWRRNSSRFRTLAHRVPHPQTIERELPAAL
jgi:hypothetical protein